MVLIAGTGEQTPALRVGREDSGIVWVEVAGVHGKFPVRLRLSPDVAFEMCNQLFKLIGVKALMMPEKNLLALKPGRSAAEPIAEEEDGW